MGWNTVQNKDWSFKITSLSVLEFITMGFQNFQILAYCMNTFMRKGQFFAGFWHLRPSEFET